MIREKIITGLFFTIVGGLVIEAFPEIIQQSVKSESSLGSAKTRPSLDDKAKEFPNEIKRGMLQARAIKSLTSLTGVKIYFMIEATSIIAGSS